MSTSPARATPKRRLWRWVLEYAARRRSALLLLGIVMIAEAACQALVPWPMKVLVDHVFRGDPAPAWLDRILSVLPGAASREGLLIVCVSAIVVLFLIVAVLGVAQAALGTIAGQRMSYDLAADVFAHLQRLSLRSHGRRSIGDLMRRVTADCGSVAVIVRDAALPAAAALAMIAAAFVMMLSMSVTLTLIAIATVPPLAIIARRCTPAALDRGYEYAQAESEIWDIVEQTLSATPAIQAFNAENEIDRRIETAYDGVLASAISMTRAQFRLKVLSGAVTAGLGAIVMVVGTYEVSAGSVTLGGLIAFLTYLAMLYAPLDTITHSMSSGTEAAGAARRILEVLAEEEQVSERPGAHVLAATRGHPMSLRFGSVTFGYEPARPVVRDIEIEVPPGATLALVGPSGAGKSTLAAMVPRLIDPWSGAVLLDGHDLRELTLRSLRDHVAMVLQETFLFPASVADNIAYGRPEASAREIEAAARAAGAHEFIERLPDGYDTVLGQRGATLSGGERQRLSIARALLKDAPILVLDEPTSSLDPAGEAGVRAAMDRLRQGRTTLLIAHRLSTVRGADLIVALDYGRVAEIGSHADLLKLGGVYARLYHLQSGVPAHD